MAENYSFFNSKDHDRKYNAQHWADYFFPLFKSGVFNGDLQVVANGGMSVKINGGYAWIDGYGYHLTDGLVLDLETASGNMNRADSIVLRLDLTNRWIKAFCKTGSYYSGIPTPPEPEVSRTIHEIVLARISVAAGITEITQDIIVDTRMDESICGWVCGTVEQIKFEQVYAQFQAYQEAKVKEVREWIDKFQNDKELELKNWFDNLKEQLTEDPAGNLQKQIGTLSDLLTENKENLVGAVNEVKESIRAPVAHLLATEEGSPLDATMGTALKGEIDEVKEEVSQLNGNLQYSTDEIDTGKTWKNGEKIYRKVVTRSVTASSVNSDIEYQTPGIKEIVNYSCFLKQDNSYYQNFYQSSYYNLSMVAVSQTNLIIFRITTGSATSGSATAIVEYTKIGS